jgi:hypothetical protein
VLLVKVSQRMQVMTTVIGVIRDLPCRVLLSGIELKYICV